MNIKETHVLVQKACKAYRHAMLHGDGQYMENGLYWYFRKTHPDLTTRPLEQILDFVDHFGRQSCYPSDTVSIQGQHSLLHHACTGYRRAEEALDRQKMDSGARIKIKEFRSNQYLK